MSDSGEVDVDDNDILITHKYININININIIVNEVEQLPPTLIKWIFFLFLLEWVFYVNEVAHAEIMLSLIH